LTERGFTAVSYQFPNLKNLKAGIEFRQLDGEDAKFGNVKDGVDGSDRNIVQNFDSEPRLW
jgi:hypothetical protein